MEDLFANNGVSMGFHGSAKGSQRTMLILLPYPLGCPPAQDAIVTTRMTLYLYIFRIRNPNLNLHLPRLHPGRTTQHIPDPSQALLSEDVFCFRLSRLVGYGLVPWRVAHQINDTYLVCRDRQAHRLVGNCR